MRGRRFVIITGPLGPRRAYYWAAKENVDSNMDFIYADSIFLMNVNAALDYGVCREGGNKFSLRNRIERRSIYQASTWS